MSLTPHLDVPDRSQRYNQRTHETWVRLDPPIRPTHAHAIDDGRCYWKGWPRSVEDLLRSDTAPILSRLAEVVRLVPHRHYERRSSNERYYDLESGVRSRRRCL